MRRAVRHGDGFFGAGSTTTAAFAEQVSTVRYELEQHERVPRSFRIAKRVYIAVDDDAAQAKAHGRRIGQDLWRLGRRSKPVAVTGSPDTCTAGLRGLADAGAEMILLNTVFDQAEQMERLAAEVMPHVS